MVKQTTISFDTHNNREVRLGKGTIIKPSKSNSSYTIKPVRLDPPHVEVPIGAAACVFDTETSGISAGSVIVQMAYIISDSNGVPLRTYKQLWRVPDRRPGFGPKWKMPWNARKVHGISEKDLRRGRSGAIELLRIAATFEALHRAGVRLIAFNASFDVRMLNQTAAAHGLHTTFDPDNYFCTMLAARPLCNMRDRRGNRRNPSNVEVYRKLLQQEPREKLHDALGDVRLSLAAYIAGKRRRWWT